MNPRQSLPLETTNSHWLLGLIASMAWVFSMSSLVFGDGKEDRKSANKEAAISCFDEKVLDFLPADALAVSVLNLAATREVKTLVERAQQQLKSSPKVEQIRKGDRFSLEELAFTIECKSKSSGTVNVHGYLKAIDRPKFLKFFEGKERIIGDKQYYSLPADGRDEFVWFPAETILVVVEKEETMKMLLQRDPTKPVAAETLKELFIRAPRGMRLEISLQDKKIDFLGMDYLGKSAKRITDAPGRAVSTTYGEGFMKTSLTVCCSDLDEAESLKAAISREWGILRAAVSGGKLSGIDDAAFVARAMLRIQANPDRTPALKEMIENAKVAKNGLCVTTTLSVKTKSDK